MKCEEVRVGVQVSRKKFHIYIHLNYNIVEFLSFLYIYIYIYKMTKIKYGTLDAVP